MLEYWLARGQRRNEIAAVGWTGALFALPGILLAAYELPITRNTIDGLALFGHGVGAGAGLAAGLAFALRGFWSNARPEWWGFVLGLALAGGATAIHLNAEQPEVERSLVASRVVDGWSARSRFSERAFRQRWLRTITVDWQSRRVPAVIDRDVILPEGSAVVLSVYDGRFGYPVIERVQRVD